jgi:hypothetical protein
MKQLNLPVINLKISHPLIDYFQYDNYIHEQSKNKTLKQSSKHKTKQIFTCKFSASPTNFQTLTKQSSLTDASKPCSLQSIALIHLACAEIEPQI